MALAPRTVQNIPDRLSLPNTVLHPLRFQTHNGCNAECIVMRSCAAQQSPIPIFSWMIC
jgi:hypothetical protein